MIASLVSFYQKNYLKSNKFIIPVLAFFAYQAMAYSVKPVGVVSGFSLSAMCVFLIMVWISFSFHEAEADITEQVIFLKVKNKIYISISKMLLMLFFGSLFSLAGTVFPLIVNVGNGGDLFTRTVVWQDVLYSLLAHILFASVGGMLGLIFHGRIIGNRKKAVLFVFFIALLTVVKGALEQDIPGAVFVTWIIPPLYDFSQAASREEYVSVHNLFFPLVGTMLYLAVQVILYIQLMKHKLFS